MGWQNYTNMKLQEMRTPKKSSGWSNKWIPFCKCFAVHLILCSTAVIFSFHFCSTAIIFMIPFCQYIAASLIPCSSSIVRWQGCFLIDATINGSSSKFAMNASLVNRNSFNFAIVSPLTPKSSKNVSRSGAVGAPGGCCCHTVVEQQHSKRKKPSHKQRSHRTTERGRLLEEDTDAEGETLRKFTRQTALA